MERKNEAQLLNPLEFVQYVIFSFRRPLNPVPLQFTLEEDKNLVNNNKYLGVTLERELT